MNESMLRLPFALCCCVVLALTVSLSAGSVIDAGPYIDHCRVDCGIQAAIDALGEDGGEVHLPAGRFELMRSIMIPSNVVLRGAGSDQSILNGKSTNEWVKVTGVDGVRLTLESMPPSLAPGVSVFAWPKRPQTGWLGYYKPGVVTAVDGNIITLDQPTVMKTKGWISFGLCSVLTEDCAKGADRLAVADAGMFVVGQAIAVGSGDGNANESLSFVKAIDGNTLILERPIRTDHLIDKHYFWKRPAVWSLFPLITAENAANFAIIDLAVRWEIAADQRPKLRRYTLSPIHLYNATDALVENVRVDNSFADGISVQTGRRVTVRNCVVTNCAGNGLHPGTGLQNSLFEDNLAEANGTGFYFCWHNQGHTVRRNRFIRNGSGITGLGNPGDMNNIIEDNLVAENRGVGLAINGGRASGNTIRRNIFRDNSLSSPGEFAAIHLYAAVEDARAYTIEGNTFENTTEARTQRAGVIEQNGERNGKVCIADENVIRGNSYVNMREADVMRAGPNTIVDEDGVKIVETSAPEKEKR